MKKLCPVCSYKFEDSNDQIIYCPKCGNDFSETTSTPTLAISKKQEVSDETRETFLNLEDSEKTSEFEFIPEVKEFNSKGRVCPICKRNVTKIYTNNELSSIDVKLYDFIILNEPKWKKILGICSLCLDYFHQLKINKE